MLFSASSLLAAPCEPSSAFFGFMGVSSAIIFANLGAAYGTAKSSRKITANEDESQNELHKQQIYQSATRT